MIFGFQNITYESSRGGDEKTFCWEGGGVGNIAYVIC